MFLYTGCYTAPNGSGNGIGVYRFDPETGAIVPSSAIGGANSPTFLAISADGSSLYAVAEMASPQGAVVAYARDPESGALTERNRQSSEGKGPCHLSIDASGRFVLVANYGSGSIAALPIAADGSLEPASSAIQHATPEEAEAGRQDGPHAHQIMHSPDGRFVFVNDLGLDRVIGYTLDENGVLIEAPGAGGSTAPGAGPRHLAFSPDGGTVYVINELDSTLGVYDYDAETGAFSQRQVLSTLPEGNEVESYCAHVLVSPDGRFVYGSNRGHDSIAIFGVGEDGLLSLLTTYGTGVTWPRNFATTPDWGWLLIANERADSIISCRRDPETGLLSEPVATIESGAPVCLVLV